MSPFISRILCDAAKFANVDPMLVLAIAEVESAGDPLAVRYERNWKYHYKVDDFAKRCRISRDTEFMLQSCSFGLMQVMGTVARECGLEGSILQLTDAKLGAKFGCIKLAKLFKVFGNVDDVIAAYNGGNAVKDGEGKYRNQSYVDKVHRVYGRQPNTP